MRYKIIIGFLVLALVVSLGFNVYYYLLTNSEQATVNNMRSYIVLSWAEIMSFASYRLMDATTNVDVSKIRSLLFIAGENIAMSADVSDGALYTHMAVTSSGVYELLLPYEDNSSQFVRSINPAAVEMIKTLAHKIRNTVALITYEWADLMNKEGIDPIQLFKGKGILDRIYSGLDDIQNQAEQIYNFSPKFQ